MRKCPRFLRLGTKSRAVCGLTKASAAIEASVTLRPAADSLLAACSNAKAAWFIGLKLKSFLSGNIYSFKSCLRPLFLNWRKFWHKKIWSQNADSWWQTAPIPISNRRNSHVERNRQVFTAAQLCHGRINELNVFFGHV